MSIDDTQLTPEQAAPWLEDCPDHGRPLYVCSQQLERCVPPGWVWTGAVCYLT